MASEREALIIKRAAKFLSVPDLMLRLAIRSRKKPAKLVENREEATSAKANFTSSIDRVA